MLEIFAKLFAAIPAVFSAAKGAGSSQTTAESLKNAFEKLKNSPPRAWQTTSVSAGLQGVNFNYPEREQEKEESQQKLLDAHDKAAASAVKLAVAFGNLGVGVAAAAVGMKLVSQHADASAHELSQWDSGLAKDISVLTRDRIRRQQALARATSFEARSFAQRENEAEAQFQPAATFFQKLSYRMAEGFQIMKGATGGLFTPAAIRESDIKGQMEMGHRTRAEAENIVDQNEANARIHRGEARRLVYKDNGDVDLEKSQWREPPSGSSTLDESIRGNEKYYTPGPSQNALPVAPPPKPTIEDIMTPLRESKNKLAQQRPPLPPLV